MEPLLTAFGPFRFVGVAFARAHLVFLVATRTSDQRLELMHKEELLTIPSGYGVDPHEAHLLANKRAAEADDAAQRARLTTVVISIGALVTLLIVFVHGVVIDHGVLDELGSTKHANAKVDSFQSINGYVTAAVGQLLETYFEVISVVIVLFLSNVPWYPGDDPRRQGGLLKRVCLLGFKPWIMIILNVAISATFVSHKTTGVLRVFLHDDLVTTKAFALSTLNASVAANLTTRGNGRSVLDTILRGAVRRQVAQFEMLTNSPCIIANQSDNEDNRVAVLPSVLEVKSTAVVYGFPIQDWNLDVLPFGLVPQHTVQFELSNPSASESEYTKSFDTFQAASKVSWSTLYELLLQGKLLFERSISDSNASAVYPCMRVENFSLFDSLEDGSDSGSGGGAEAGVTGTSTTKPPPSPTTKNPTPTTAKPASGTTPAPTTKSPTTPTPTTKKPATRWLQANASDAGSYDQEDLDDLDSDVDTFEDGPYKGMKRCYGAVSSLERLANMTDPSMHTLSAFVETMVTGFIDTIPQVEPESMDLTLATYKLGPQIQLTAMTLDMPYYENTTYRNTTEMCNGDNDEYPAAIFDRALQLPSGERVPMDEYVVDSATFHFHRDTDKKVFL